MNVAAWADATARRADAPPIAFYAPMKSPNHPTPSGDRRMARLYWRALETAGFAPILVSELRAWRARPERCDLEALRSEGLQEAENLIARYDATAPAQRPRLWFTYHLYYKAPDYLGPRVAALHDMPYVAAEPSRAPKRLKDEWAEHAEDAEAAIDLADLLICMTDRDRPALEAHQTKGQEIVAVAPFLDLGPRPEIRPVSTPVRLLTVAMMRSGDKTASYQTLAASLAEVSDLAWRLEIVGDGPERSAIEGMFAPFGDRVRFLGRVDDPQMLQTAYAAADLFVWPGVGEAYGMAYLEAQAGGAPVLAEDRPGVRDVAHVGRLAPANAPAAFGRALRDLIADPEALSALRARARFEVESRHSLDTAAETLRQALAPLIADTK
ncbi:MAG: glycosyltransferase family 4 protein [Pseudomonadota bacterium]